MAQGQTPTTLDLGDLRYDRSKKAVHYQGRDVPVKDFLNGLGIRNQGDWQDIGRDVFGIQGGGMTGESRDTR